MTNQHTEQHRDDTQSTVLNPSEDKVLLIDLENCPSQINMLLKDLEQFSHVVICYAQSGAKIPLDWLMPLTEMVNSHKLKIVKMPNGGKNAADFGICFFAGMLMQQLSPYAQFVIMSEDADLEHTVRLLRSHGRKAERIAIKKEEKPATPKLDMSEVSTLAAAYSKKMLIHNNKPSTKTTLLNSLKSHCGQDMGRAEAVFNYLSQMGAIVMGANDKPTYHLSIIQKLTT